MLNRFIDKMFLKPVSTIVFALITLVMVSPAYSDPAADAYVGIQYLPVSGSPIEDSASSQVSSGLTAEEVSNSDFTNRKARASATTGSEGNARAFAQVYTLNTSNPDAEYGDIHRAESTATFIVPWIVESTEHEIGDIIADGIFLDLNLHAELQIKFDTYQQRTCDDLSNPHCPFEMGDSISAEGTLGSLVETNIDLSIRDPGEPMDADVLYSLQASLDSSGDNLCVDDGDADCGNFGDDDTITNLSYAYGLPMSDGTNSAYWYEIDKLISIELNNARVGDVFELVLSTSAIVELEGITEDLNIIATSDLENTASYSLRSDIEGLTFTALVDEPNPVPIPSAVWLFSSGLIGLIGVARKKKS